MSKSRYPFLDEFANSQSPKRSNPSKEKRKRANSIENFNQAIEILYWKPAGSFDMIYP